MKKIFFLSTIVIFFGLFISFPVLAEEVIDDFSVTIKINEDSSINVTEEIKYNFGDGKRHGIYRDIPFKYTAKGGNYNLRITDISVVDKNSNSYIFEVIKSGAKMRIKIGDPNSLIFGRKNYNISYTVKRAINFFDNHDELYWNATGDEWPVEIKQEKVSVILPKNTEEKDIKVECFAGPKNSAEKCISSRYKYTSKDMVSGFVFTNDKLKSGEGITIVVGVPKGVVIKPSFLESTLDIIRDNRIIGVPILTLIILFYLWYTRGRDPEGRKTIITQFNAPDDLTPAEVGTIIDERAHKKDISAEIINLAVRGYLKITILDKKHSIASEDYEFLKIKEGSDLTGHEKELFTSLFSNNKTKVKLSSLKNKFYKDLEEIKKHVYESIVQKGYFSKNPNKVRNTYLVIGIVILFLSWFAGPIFNWIGVLSLAISGIMIIFFSFIMPKKTKKGVLAKEHILGLKDYITVAEKDRINFHNAPAKNPKVFEKLLPFAMVLSVEKEWARQFEDIYNEQPSWYSDASGHSFSALALSDSLASFQTKANTTLSSTPSSAAGGGSGFSGGGAGGGFGGGGGGSW